MDQMIAPVPERPLAYSLAQEERPLTALVPPPPLSPTMTMPGEEEPAAAALRSWTDDIGPVQLFMLCAMAVLLLASLLRMFDWDAFLVSVGFLPPRDERPVLLGTAEQQQPQQPQPQEQQEEVRYRSGSARDAVPVDAAAEMDSAMTGTSLEPSFVDPTRGAAVSGAVARRPGYFSGTRAEEDVRRPPQSTGGWSTSSTWSDALFGSLGSTTSVGTSGYTGILDRGTAQPVAPRLEYTQFQPAKGNDAKDE